MTDSQPPTDATLPLENTIKQNFEKKRPVPKGVVWCEGVGLYGLEIPAEVGTSTWLECYAYNSLCEGFKVGHKLASESITSTLALDCLSAAFKNDLNYAWTWHCNLAMAMQDQGMGKVQSQVATANFMKQAFDVDTRNCEEYKEWQKMYKDYETKDAK